MTFIIASCKFILLNGRSRYSSSWFEACMATILLYGLYFLVPALLLVVSAWLAVTLYIVWKRRKYAHIPSPKLPRYVAVCVASWRACMDTRLLLVCSGMRLFQHDSLCRLELPGREGSMPTFPLQNFQGIQSHRQQTLMWYYRYHIIIAV